MPRGPQAFHLLLLPLMAAALMLLGACENLPIEDFSNVPVRKEPRVDPATYVHTVAFAPADDRLDGATRERLDAFMARADVGYGDDVWVIAAEPATAEGARIADRRRATVVAYLAHRRIEARPAEAGFGIAVPPPDAVAVMVRRYVVTLPGCPDWTGRPGRSFNNTVSSNWGCATATNLGLMVANPADLVSGRHPGLMDGSLGALATERYRRGETKPLMPEDGGTVEMQQTGTSQTITATEGK